MSDPITAFYKKKAAEQPKGKYPPWEPGSKQYAADVDLFSHYAGDQLSQASATIYSLTGWYYGHPTFLELKYTFPFMPQLCENNGITMGDVISYENGADRYFWENHAIVQHIITNPTLLEFVFGKIFSSKPIRKESFAPKIIYGAPKYTHVCMHNWCDFSDKNITPAYMHGVSGKHIQANKSAGFSTFGAFPTEKYYDKLLGVIKENNNNNLVIFVSIKPNKWFPICLIRYMGGVRVEVLSPDPFEKALVTWLLDIIHQGQWQGPKEHAEVPWGNIMQFVHYNKPITDEYYVDDYVGAIMLAQMAYMMDDYSLWHTLVALGVNYARFAQLYKYQLYQIIASSPEIMDINIEIDETYINMSLRNNKKIEGRNMIMMIYYIKDGVYRGLERKNIGGEINNTISRLAVNGTANPLSVIKNMLYDLLFINDLCEFCMKTNCDVRFEIFLKHRLTKYVYQKNLSYKWPYSEVKIISNPKQPRSEVKIISNPKQPRSEVKIISDKKSSWWPFN